MKKLSIKELIEFRGKSDIGKRNFAANVKQEKIKASTDGGGDYWVSSLSAISNSYKTTDLRSIISKLEDLKKKHAETEYPKTQTMYKRNIGILANYADFDLKNWRPEAKLKFLTKHKDDLILTIKGLQVKVSPQHVFAFPKKETEEVGGIWFIAKLDGFKKNELGMFCDILFKYLSTYFANDYTINPEYCIAVDVYNKHDITYSQLERGAVPRILEPTLDEIVKLMKFGSH